MARSLLLIEPDVVLRKQYALALRDEFDVSSAATAQQALDVLDGTTHRIDVIVMDFSLGSNNGVEFLHEVRSYDDWVEIPVVMMSAVPNDRVPQDKLTTYGVEKLLYKPQLSPVGLRTQVCRVLS